MDLGGGLRAELRRGTLAIVDSRPVPPAPEVPLPVPGRARWGGWEISAAPAGGPLPTGDREALLREGGELVEVVDAAAVAGPLAVRGRREGDRFHPLGAPGSKKLKEFFRERGVLPAGRDRSPLVADSRGILWVVGHRIAERCRVGPASGEMLRLAAKRGTDSFFERRNAGAEK